MSTAVRLSRALRPLMQVAVVGSVGLILFGMSLCFVRHPSYLFSPAELAILSNPGAAKVSEEEVFVAAAHLEGQAIVLLGLMTLMVTPIVSVFLAVAFFVRARQWAYAAISVAVLLLLLLSALLGRASG
ncbi:MAG: DUF1634 domain-containing protein [Acidobacteria bacterium]|jgi:uncharacterized membrane protein|nr:DUF1634 domain-containing protein [Acidobacteriota bacterium]